MPENDGEKTAAHPALLKTKGVGDVQFIMDCCCDCYFGSN